jgi:hypothetical protein
VKGYIARAMRAGLSKEGEPSLLGGTDCGNVVLQRGVDLQRGVSTMEMDNYVGLVDIASIDVAHDPVVDDVLQHPATYDTDGVTPLTYNTFKLDRLVHDNGVVRQFIVVARP